MTYYRTPPRINYICGSCGLPSVSNTGIVQCLKCSIPLCHSCNRGYLCPQHFEELKPENQHRVLEINKELQKMRGFGFIFLFILPILFIPVVIVPLAMSSNFNVLFIPLIVIGMTFIPIILIMVAIFSRKKKSDDFFLEIRKIVSADLGSQISYTQSRFSYGNAFGKVPSYSNSPTYQPAPTSGPAYQPAPTSGPAYQPAPAYKPQNYGEAPQKLVCSDCGFENPPGMRYCGDCGKKLL